MGTVQCKISSKLQGSTPQQDKWYIHFPSIDGRKGVYQRKENLVSLGQDSDPDHWEPRKYAACNLLYWCPQYPVRPQHQYQPQLSPKEHR